MTDLIIAAVGLSVGFLLRDWLERRRRRVLSNWEPGMKIETSDGETLYLVAVEPTE